MFVTTIVVLPLSAPLTPVTGSENVPAATVEATLIVTKEDPLAGFGLNVPVNPVGQLAAARVTAELKPFTAFTVMVELPVPPVCVLAALADSVKPGVPAAVTVSGIEVLPLTVPPVPVTTSE